MQICGRGDSAGVAAGAAAAGSEACTLRFDRKANRDPSGLHRGEFELTPSAVRRRGVDRPSISTTQMDVLRRLRFWSTVVRTYAACLPSGEMCASLMFSNAK